MFRYKIQRGFCERAELSEFFLCYSRWMMKSANMNYFDNMQRLGWAWATYQTQTAIKGYQKWVTVVVNFALATFAPVPMFPYKIGSKTAKICKLFLSFVLAKDECLPMCVHTISFLLPRTCVTPPIYTWHLYVPKNRILAISIPLRIAHQHRNEATSWMSIFLSPISKIQIHPAKGNSLRLMCSRKWVR